MEEQKVYYTYSKFKKLTEERRWFTKLFVFFSKDDWESCGKGILKFYQIENNRLIDIKKKEDLNLNLQNLFLIIDTLEVKDNNPEDLERANNYQSILKTQDFTQKEVICFYNIKYAHNFYMDNEKIIRWCHLYPSNDQQQIALSFNDKVALYHTWEIFCKFKQLDCKLPIPFLSEDNLDEIIDDLTENQNNLQELRSDAKIPYYADDEIFITKIFRLFRKTKEEGKTHLFPKLANILRLLISCSTKPDIILQAVNDQNYRDFFHCLKYMNEKNCPEFEQLIDSFINNEFNNIFGITNEDILKTIQINQRLMFLKDIIFPDLFTQDQSTDLSDYLILHGNNIIMYFIDSMSTCFEVLDTKLILETEKIGNFFHELSYVLRFFCFPMIKTEFSNTFAN